MRSRAEQWSCLLLSTVPVASCSFPSAYTCLPESSESNHCNTASKEDLKRRLENVELALPSLTADANSCFGLFLVSKGLVSCWNVISCWSGRKWTSGSYFVIVTGYFFITPLSLFLLRQKDILWGKVYKWTSFIRPLKKCEDFFYSWWNQQLLPIFDAFPLHLTHFNSRFFESTDCVFTVISLANGKISYLKWDLQENLLNKFPNIIVYIVVFPLISHLSCFFF